MAKAPESVEWLLGFFNIKSIAGEYNPKKLLFARKPNRTPTVPPKNRIDPETRYVTDHKGYVYVPGDNNKPECIGKENFFPTSSDFREYFENSKIGNASIVKNEEMFLKISWLWNDLSMAFARIVTANQPIDTDRLLSKGVVIDIEEEQEIGQSIIRSHCQKYLDNYDEEALKRMSLGWLPDIKQIPDIIYIGILAWSNCEELHSHLKQCPCCGTFRIQEKKRGRPSDFCNNKKCGNVINSWARKKESEKKKEYREHKRKKERPKVIKHIRGNTFEKNSEGHYRCVSNERAEEIYEELNSKSPKIVSSLEECERTYRPV